MIAHLNVYERIDEGAWKPSIFQLVRVNLKTIKSNGFKVLVKIQKQVEEKRKSKYPESHTKEL